MPEYSMNPEQHFTNLVEDARGRLAGIDFADARLENVRSLWIEGKPLALRQYGQAALSAGVRVFRDDQMAFCSARGFVDFSELLSCGIGICMAARFPGVPREPGVNDRLVTSMPKFPEPVEFPVQFLGRWASELEQRIGTDLQMFGESHSGVRAVTNSQGTCAIRALAFSRIAITAQVPTREGRMAKAYWAEGALRPETLLQVLPERCSKFEAAVASLRESVAAQATRCDVVLSPSVSGFLIHEAFGHLCEADRIPDECVSSTQRDVQVACPELNVWDIPHQPHATGSIPFDDEGIVARPVQLIKAGRWIGRLHSRSTYRPWGVEPSGCARVTAADQPPICRMRITAVSPGRHSLSELIGSVQSGIFLDWPYGGHIRGDVIAVLALHGRKIENGKLTTPISGARLIGRPLALLQQIEAIADSVETTDGGTWCTRGIQKDLPVTISAPAMLLRGATLQPC